MFCSNCGEKLAAEAVQCPACRHAVSQEGPPRISAAARGELGQGSRDAGAFIKELVQKPGTGVADGVKGMPDRRALVSGAILAGAVALGLAWGASGAATSMIGLPLRSAGFGKLVIAGLFPTLALAATRVGARSLFGNRASVGQDLLGSAGVLIPIALAVLAARLLGIGNVEVAIVLMAAACVFFIVGLHETARSVAGINERAAPAVITVEILLATWLVKVLGVALW